MVLLPTLLQSTTTRVLKVIVWMRLYLARQAVLLIADIAEEDIHVVFEDAKAAAVRCFAVEDILHGARGLLHRLVEVPLVVFRRDQLEDKV